MLNRGEICTKCQGRRFFKAVSEKCQDGLGRSFAFMLEAYWHKYMRSYDFVDRFIAPSKFMANLIRQRVPKKKIMILPNGVDTDMIKPRYSDDGYALYFGRVSKEKGIESLLQAHKKLDLPLVLKVVGDGPIIDSLRKKYPKVEYLGYKTGKDLHRVVCGAAFVVVPSECYENCSMSVLEGMAAGKAVVGSRIGGIPEQIEDEKTGFLFESGNAEDLTSKMRLLAENPEVRCEFGKAARERVEREYSLKHHCERLVEIYNSLVDS